MKELAVGIDIGTTGVRAVAMDRNGRIIATAATALADLSKDHRDPQTWRGAFEQTLDKLFSTVDPAWVAALSVDGTSGTVLAVDGNGQPLAQPLMYNDPVADSGILATIAKLAPRQSAAHGATSGLAKALVFADLPGVVRTIHQADWLAGFLSGRFDLSDENNALKTGYDPVERAWPRWIAKTGLDLSLLPQVLPAGALMGPVCPAATARFGLSPEAQVIAGTTDGCASFLATGASRPGDAVTALGTTLTVKILSEVALFAPEFGLYSHRIGDMWLAGGASNSGGNVLRHFFNDAQLLELTGRIEPGKELDLGYYPLVKPGERFPVNDPALAPRMTPRPAEDYLFLQALLEGMADIEALAYGRLAELGAPALASVRTVGGGARNPAWTTIRSQKIKAPFVGALSEEAAAGTALLALGKFSVRTGQ